MLYLSSSAEAGGVVATSLGGCAAAGGGADSSGTGGGSVSFCGGAFSFHDEDADVVVFHEVGEEEQEEGLVLLPRLL